MRRRTGHVQIDDVLGSAGEMRLARRQGTRGIAPSRLIASGPVIREQGEGESAQAKVAIAQKVPARDVQQTLRVQLHRGFLNRQWILLRYITVRRRQAQGRPSLGVVG